MAELRIAANWQVSGTGIWGVTPLNVRVRIAEVTLIAPSNGVNWVDHARLIAVAPDMLTVLREVEEFLDDRADADQPAGSDHPIPNDEMRMLAAVRTVLSKVEG
jgi:hypothetical protein